MLDVECRMWDVRYGMFDCACLIASAGRDCGLRMFAIQYSLFDVRCSILNNFETLVTSSFLLEMASETSETLETFETLKTFEPLKQCSHSH